MADNVVRRRMMVDNQIRPNFVGKNRTNTGSVPADPNLDVNKVVSQQTE